MDEFHKVGDKTQGVTVGGIFSKVKFFDDGDVCDANVTATSDPELWMIKDDEFGRKIIEKISGPIYRFALGEDRAPEIKFIVNEDKKDDLLIGSKFLDRFATLYDFLEKYNIPEDCMPYGCDVSYKGIKCLADREAPTIVEGKVFKGYEDVVVFSKFMGR